MKNFIRMQCPRNLCCRGLVFGFVALSGLMTSVIAQSTEINYQGYLKELEGPVTGDFDFQFSLFDAPVNGNDVGSPVTAENLAVVDGIFSTGLDFGPDAFSSTERYLEIAVRPGDSVEPHSILPVRVPIRTVPFSQFSQHSVTSQISDSSQTSQTSAFSDDADLLDGLDSLDFSNSDHVHSGLFVPGESVTPAASMLADGNLDLSNGLLINGQELLSSDQAGVIEFQSSGINSSLKFTASEGGVSVLGGAPELGTAVYGVQNQDDPDAPNGGFAFFESQGDDVGGGSSSTGGETIITSGNGSNTGAGGDGGDVQIQAGRGRGSGDNRGGNIHLIPGVGSSGSDGSVVIQGVTEFTQPVILEDDLIDSTGSSGNDEQVLRSTNLGTVWGTLYKLFTPSGNDVALETDNSQNTILNGRLYFPNGESIVNDTDRIFRFYTDNSGSDLSLALTDSTISLFGRPDLSNPSGKFSIRASPTSGVGNPGIDMDLVAGNANDGIGGEGKGGDLTLIGGDAAGISGHIGGSIIMSPGSGSGAEPDGFISVLGSISFNRSNAEYPIHVGNNASDGNGAHLTNGGVWVNGSDRHSKTDVEEVDSQDILNRVIAMPVTSWRYLSESGETRHMGPMAQDFMASFGLGESDRHIGTVDIDGVSLAAIKGLHEKLMQESTALQEENTLLRKRLERLENAFEVSEK